MTDDYEQGSIDAANGIIAFLRAKGHGGAANDVLQGWEDGTITGAHHEAGNQIPGGNGTWVGDKRREAQAQGFTGDQCTNCNSMQISGHCQVCADCGTTTGCS